MGGKKERRGLRGIISSARSLGWRRGGSGGEDDEVTDDMTGDDGDNGHDDDDACYDGGVSFCED